MPPVRAPVLVRMAPLSGKRKAVGTRPADATRVCAMTDERRFSHSLVDTYLDCPRKAYYRYVEEVPSPKTAALVRGSACDEGWNEYLLRKIDGEDMPLEDLLTAVEENFRADVRKNGGVSEIDWGDSNARATLDSALELAAIWHGELGPQIQPTAVQVEYHRRLKSGRDFVGFTDYEGLVPLGVGDAMATVVGDNKTGSRAMPQGDADKALQPSAYGWLKDEPITFAFTRAIETKSGTHKTETILTSRSKAANEWYGEMVETVERGWVAGVFPPNPKSNLCSPKWCPFFERCQPHRTLSGPPAGEAE